MPFPTTGLLDNFNRANENPLANGTWSGPLFVGNSQLRLLANQAAAQGVTANNSYWSARTFGPDSEAFLTIATLPANGNNVNLYLRMINPNSANTSGYEMNVQDSVTPGTYNQYRYRRDDNGVPTQLGAITAGPTLAAGNSLGLEMIGSTLKAYVQRASVWSAVDAGRTDTTYTAAGNIGARIDDTTSRLDNFSGGTVTVVFSRPIFYNKIRRPASYN